MELARSLDDEAVRRRLDRGAHRREHRHHRLDAVRLLHDQLLRLPNHRGSVGEAAKQGDKRQLVDGPRNLAALHRHAAQRGGAHHEVGHGFAARLAFFLQLDGGAHPPEDIEQAGARRVDADPLDVELGVGVAGAQHEPGGGAGDVAGDSHPERLQAPRPADADGAALSRYGGAHRRKHLLGVVTGGDRFGDARAPLDRQPSQQKRRLHLRARDGHLVLDGSQVPAPDGDGGQGVAAPGGDAGAHAAQRLNDATHGPPSQGVVPRQHAEERLGRQQPRQEPHRRAAVPAIERVFALVQAVQPRPPDARLRGARGPVDLDPEGGHARRRRAHIV